MAREKRQLGLRALECALDRTRDAQTREEETAFYASVAEVVWWLTMLDEALWATKRNGEQYASVRSSDEGGSILLGVRYARNRQVHDTEVTAMQGNPLLALEEPDGDRWVWRSLDDEGVPPYDPREGDWGREGERVYQRQMAGGAIVPTLELAASFLNEWIVKMPD
ncbi:MAG: hypothetical protein WD473_10675 [Acidimicrobiia bacterium]